MYLGEFEISSNVPFNFQALGGGGQAVDADETPTFEVYVNNAAMDPEVTGQLTKIAGQTGFYGGVVAATAANGFEAGNTYTVRITAVIEGVETLTTDTFRLTANAATSTTAVFEQTSLEDNQVSVDADNPFDAFAINASKHFKRAGGNEIIVYPDGVSERTVVAIINYKNIEEIPGLNHGKSRSITITVDNNEMTGLSTNEFINGKSAVMIAEQIGGTPVKKPLTKIVSQDAGMATYQVR